MLDYTDADAPPLFCCDSSPLAIQLESGLCTGLLQLISVRRMDDDGNQCVTLECERCKLRCVVDTPNEAFAYWLARRGSPESWPSYPPYFGPTNAGPET